MLVLEFHINHFVWLSEEYSPFKAVFNLFITPRPGPVRNRGKTLDETFLVPPTVRLVRCGIGHKLRRDSGLRINYGGKQDLFLVGGHRGRGWGKKFPRRRKRNVANAANPVSLTPKWDRYGD